MRIELIDRAEMRRIWSLKWAIVTAAIAALPVAYLTLPDDWLPAIPGWLKLLCAVAVMAGASGTAAVRVIRQASG